MRRTGLMAALALIVLVNTIALLDVRYNRSGTADAEVTMTERELHLVSNSKENSGISFKLVLNSGYRGQGEASPWFDRKKLEEIGFDCSTPLTTKDAALHYGRALPRRTYVVLEYEGKAWETRLALNDARLKALELEAAQGAEGEKTLEAERKWFAWEKESGSRLFSIDVGNDAAKLRTRYPDRKRYIITPAKVGLQLLTANRYTPVLSGYVADILTGTIHVPRDRQGLLTSLKSDVQYFYYDGEKNNFAPRYKTTLSYGRHYEPRVAEVMAN